MFSLVRTAVRLISSKPTQHQIVHQAAQMAQQMQPQQVLQQPVLVTLPDWDGKDADRHLDLLDATLQANGETGILSETQCYSALLLTSCKNEPKAT